MIADEFVLTNIPNRRKSKPFWKDIRRIICFSMLVGVRSKENWSMKQVVVRRGEQIELMR